MSKFMLRIWDITPKLYKTLSKNCIKHYPKTVQKILSKKSSKHCQNHLEVKIRSRLSQGHLLQILSRSSGCPARLIMPFWSGQNKVLNWFFDWNPHPRNLILNGTIFICHFFFENWSVILAGSRVGGIFLHCTHLDEMHIFIVFAICIIYEIA